MARLIKDVKEPLNINLYLRGEIGRNNAILLSEDAINTYNQLKINNNKKKVKRHLIDVF
jgi:hypothetical protein